MALINLLPWREEYRQEKRKEFLVVLVLVLILAVVASLGWKGVVSAQVEDQQARNQRLTDGIRVLDNQLKEINTLKERKKQFIERMDVIQNLQGNRAEIVKVFDEFVRAVPDGVFFTAMERKGDQISLTGFAESNVRVSALMRQLDESDKFVAPDLKKIEADPTLGEQGSRFELSVKISTPEALLDSVDGSQSKGA